MNMKRWVILLSVALFAVCFFYLLCPKPELRHYVPYSRAYYDANGELLRLSLAKDDRYRLYEPLSNISPKLVEATILYEDQDFYTHAGVDVVALFRAFWTTYIVKERRIGASTIVMQLARLRWQINSSTLRGKIYQVLRAIQLVRHYSKKEILEVYLNLTPYGRNIEGVAAASLIYFNKQANELSLLEALTLSVIPQNPNRRNPSNAQGYKKLLIAREVLFKRWVDHHPEDKKIERFLDMALAIRPPEKLPFESPHFINFINNDLSVWDRGSVETTLNLQIQKRLEKNVAEYVASKRKIGIANASALLVNYETMSVEAMVGSSDFFNDAIQGQVNGVTAKRSPGSTLKPFVYALALDQGLIHPLSLMRDLPKKFGGFTPENFDKRFLGPISATEALIQSRNVPAVDLQEQLRGTSFYRFLIEAGVSGLKEEAHYGLALALGGGELTAIELASLYSGLANAGVFRPIHYFKGSPKSPGIKLLSKEASYLTLDMLKNNPAPSALDIDIPGSRKNDVPWKTGTSWAFRDAWAVGISGPYVLVVWVGNFDGKGNDSFIGRTAAGPLFFDIFESIFPPQNWHIEDFFAPENMNLKRLSVCANTGDLYEKHCPATEETWFIPGVSPIKLSNIYREFPINSISGKRACFHRPGKTELKVYEFWPSEFQKIFAMAGISLKEPPDFDEHCSMNLTSALGVRPEITSPQSSIDYVVRFGVDEKVSIPFIASVDAGVKRLHWFINSSYITSAKPKEIVTWNVKPGEYEVKVVDDFGRSGAKRFRVVSSLESK